MLKHRELHECNELFELLIDPSVFPYVRQKATSADEYWFMTKQLIEEEQEGKTISRTITDDWGQPIGTISIFDVQDGAGFLGTWLGLLRAFTARSAATVESFPPEKETTICSSSNLSAAR